MLFMNSSILLLRIIEKKGRLSVLTDKGLTHSQIALLLDAQQKEGNVILNDEGIFLTEQGRNVLNQISNSSNFKDYWIVQQERHYREPISTKVIVLPKKKKL